MARPAPRGWRPGCAPAAPSSPPGSLPRSAFGAAAPPAPVRSCVASLLSQRAGTLSAIFPAAQTAFPLWLPPVCIDAFSRGRAPGRFCHQLRASAVPEASPCAYELRSPWPSCCNCTPACIYICVHFAIFFALVYVHTLIVIYPSFAPQSPVCTCLYILLPHAFVCLYNFTGTYKYSIFLFHPFYTFA